MKNILALCLALLLVFMLFCACGTATAAKDAETAVDAFYSAYNDQNFSALAELLHTSAIANYGAQAEASAHFEIIYGTLGSATEYQIVSSHTDETDTQVSFEIVVQATYENGYDGQDSFIVRIEDKNTAIARFDISAFDKAAVESSRNDESATTAIDTYYSLYAANDIEAIINMHHPVIRERFPSYSEIYAYYAAGRVLHGDVLSYTISSINSSVPQNQDIFYEITVNAEYAFSQTTDVHTVIVDSKGKALLAGSDNPDPSSVSALVNSFEELFYVRDFEGLYTLLSPSTQQYFPKDLFIEAFYLVLAEHGEVEQIKEYSLSRIYQDYDDSTIAVCKYKAEYSAERKPFYLELFLGMEDDQLYVVDLNYELNRAGGFVER